MVYLIREDECMHSTCNGGTKAPEGVFGGSHCICPCHESPEMKEKMVAAQNADLEDVLKKIVR